MKERELRNTHHMQKIDEMQKLKFKAAQEEAAAKFKALPVIICSKGCVEFTPVELFKREGAITSASGTEEITPLQTHRCNVCQKLMPYASQIGGIPDILISDCKIHTTDDPELLQILSNWVFPTNGDAPYHKSWDDPEEFDSRPETFLQYLRRRLRNFFAFRK